MVILLGGRGGGSKSLLIAPTQECRAVTHCWHYLVWYQLSESASVIKKDSTKSTKSTFLFLLYWCKWWDEHVHMDADNAGRYRIKYNIQVQALVLSVSRLIQIPSFIQGGGRPFHAESTALWITTSYPMFLWIWSSGEPVTAVELATRGRPCNGLERQLAAGNGPQRGRHGLATHGGGT